MMMTKFLKPLALSSLVLVAASSCKDRDMEKRILALERDIAELKEGKKTADPNATTVSTPTPATEPVTGEKPEGPLPVAQFANLEHDFGTVKEGQVVEYTFAVKNTGQAPLLIQKADPSCGCTVPDWTKDPIPVGGTGFVKAKFDSSGKSGAQNKTITVTANTWPKQTVLRFKANITPKASGADGPVK
jgi:hypothetical protein